MQKDLRLTRSKDFVAVRRQRRGYSDCLLVIKARRNSLEVTRIGFSVSRRVGNAVTRNRIKRRLREAARLSSMEEGWDLVLIARKGASFADYHGLNRSLTSLMRRAGILGSRLQGDYRSSRVE